MHGKKSKLIAGIVISGTFIGHVLDFHSHMDLVIDKFHLPHENHVRQPMEGYTTMQSTSTMFTTTTSTTV